MFRWRSHERNKITAVFKFQFHVTQVAEYGGDGLVISIVPADNGKPTAKLDKCVIKDNNCYWENPVNVTVKLIQDPKSAKIFDLFYYFLISTGANKESLVGEFCVNIAEYVGASAKPCSISFPFKNSYSNSHLHVSIQRILQNDNQRDVEGNGSPQITEDVRSLRQYFSNGDVEESVRSNSVECLPDQPLRKTASDQVRLNGLRRGSIGSDITLSSSDSSSGLNTPRELEVKGIATNKDQQRSQWELAIVPVNDTGSVYSMNSPRDVFSSDRSLMVVDDSVEKLRADLVAVSRRAEVSELELQTLRKQIVKESKKGQDLLRELTSVKEERNALNGECEKLKASRKCADEFRVRSKFQFEGDPWALLEEIKEELTYEKDLNTNLRIQLQKTQDSNAELIFAVQDLEEMLEKNDREVSGMPNRLTSGESAVEIEESMLKCQSEDDEEQKALEELVKQHSDAHESYLLEQKVMDLCSEIEMYRRDKDELEMQMEQLALDYEILKQENHEYCSKLEQSHLQDQLKMHCDAPSSHLSVKELQAQREKLENDLKDMSQELSDCLVTMKDLEVRNQCLEEELRKQSEGSKADIKVITSVKVQLEQRAAQAEVALTQSNAIVNELETKIENLKNERTKYLEELSGSLAKINALETCNHNLKVELDQQEQGFEADMKAFARAKLEQERRAMQAEEAVAWRDNNISELETRIKRLEIELKTLSEETSGSLATVRELETHIQNLEEEMEKQAEDFGADLEVVTRAKVEQEQRAIRAEEALRLMKWKNTNTAARIQDEFKRLSTQMQSSFEANVKLASKALAEASELRMQNHHLQDLLRRANEELQSSKHEYETKLHELCSQVNSKSNQIEEMESEILIKSKLVDNQRIRIDEFQNSVSAQQDLRAEIERLISENKSLNKQAKQEEVLRSELEQMKTLIKEKDQLLQKENVDSTIASMKEVAGKSLEELNMLRFQQDEKDQMVKDLQSIVEELRAQYDNLKHSLYENESEKEKLRTQVVQLKAEIKKKDEAVLNIEKKLKEISVREVVHDKSKANFKNTKPEGGQRGHKEAGSKELTTLKERIKLLEGQIKSKEAALETSANAFLTKEQNLRGKIEELEFKLGELGQCPGAGQDIKAQKENVSVGTQVCNSEEVTSAGYRPEEGSAITENSCMELNRGIPSDTQPAVSNNNSGDQQKFDILLKEMVLLKEKNNSMEMELKEMQERYSEISLKFAEVEGERQQLVMRVRNLKNSRKS